MYAWKRGFTDKDGKTPWWALLGAGAFALFAAIASFGIGSAVQSSAMTEVISTNLPGVPAWGIGLAIVIMVSVVVGVGLMLLVFISSRRGYDEQVTYDFGESDEPGAPK